MFEGNKTFQIVQGDITKEEVDAIVNAANASLSHGGGVAGIIARKGGPIVQKESNDWVKAHGPVCHESPAYTSAGNLPCKYIIHAVGPVWGSGDEDVKLKAAIQGSLQVAEMLDLKSISLPAISTGIFGFPKEMAARIIFETIDSFFGEKQASSLEIARLILFDQSTVNTFLKIWDDQSLL